MTHADDTFLTKRITNSDIYTKLVEIEQHVVRTNGRVWRNSINVKLLWGGLSVILTSIIIILTKIV